MARLSGDQNGSVAFSVPANGFAETVFNDRTHRRDCLSDVATKASIFPSGDSAIAVGSMVGGASISKRTSSGSRTGRREDHKDTATAAALAIITAVTHHVRRGGALNTVVRRDAASPDSLSASSIWNRASAASRSLRLGSFCKQRRSRDRTTLGVSAGSAAHSGSVFNTSLITSTALVPSNARRPVSISYSTQPKAQISARLSTALPRACSGAMYAAVPRIIPARVIAGVVIVGDIDTLGDDPATGSIAFAMPKSSTFTVPSVRTFTLAGLRSR